MAGPWGVLLLVPQRSADGPREEMELKMPRLRPTHATIARQSARPDTRR